MALKIRNESTGMTIPLDRVLDGQVFHINENRYHGANCLGVDVMRLGKVQSTQGDFYVVVVLEGPGAGQLATFIGGGLLCTNVRDGNVTLGCT